MKTFEMISKAEMARELERLKEYKVSDRYTISDMCFLTGWTEHYLRILEHEGRIPAPKRDEVVRGFGRKNNLGRRYWDEEGARAILAFRRAQDAKHQEKTRQSGA